MNLVFDKWDENGNPIPNFNYLNEKVVCDAITYPVFLNDLYLEKPIKHCKIENINKFENFYVQSPRIKFLKFLDKFQSVEPLSEF